MTSIIPSNLVKSDVDYGSYLHHFNLKPEWRGPWAIVGQSDRTQGWKLHLSTIPGEAILLLDRVIPCLLAHQIPSFKIARDTMTLGYLNEGELGSTQVGKFMTIYPRDDTTAVSLAHELVSLTQGMHGPFIVSDLPLGDVVYTRYGGFNPIIKRDRLGLIHLMIYAPDGTLQEDQYQVPFQTPKEIANPFQDWPFQQTLDDAQPTPIHVVDGKQTRLFGPGYLILGVLREQSKGSVFKVLDLRCQQTVGLKVLKQGKRFCMADHFDRDMRKRLQRQANLHQHLAPYVPVPQADAYFEVDGDGYLPLEWIEGQSIETLAVKTMDNVSFALLPIEKKNLLLGWCQKLLAVIAQLHQLGYVHRDLTASNIWLGENDNLYLLDLELCHALDDPTPAFGLGTAGFMSPQQAKREPPHIADDLYAIGCLLLLALTGIDPRRVLQENSHDLLQCLQGMTQLSCSPLLEIIAHCVHPNPTMRPSLSMISSTLAAEIAHQNNLSKEKHDVKLKIISPIELKSILQRGIDGLLQQSTIQTESGLWLSTSIQGTQHQVKHRYAQQYELRCSANRGVAGVVYALSRFARAGLLTEEYYKRVQAAITWLMSTPQTPDVDMPGLHFGSAGVAMAIIEAITAHIQTPTSTVIDFIKSCITHHIDWPDITHGAAGQGVAALYCWDHLGESFFREHAQCCAAYLKATQQSDGSWIMPEGVPGMSGETLSGFAHGVAGMAYFLVELASREQDNGILECAMRALDWLQKHAVEQQYEGSSILFWPYSDRNPAIWKWWCHGGPGIALTFLRFYQHLKNPLYAEIARKALRIHPFHLRYPNLSQCHGISGLGDIFIEAFRVLEEEEWLKRAYSLATSLVIMGRSIEGNKLCWLTEDPHVITGDLMVGSAGILHFLLRLTDNEKQVGGPLLLK